MSFYIKLDCDWYNDPKILEFQEMYGKAALVDVIKLYCALGEFYGQINLNEPKQRLHLQNVIGKKGKALETFLERCASAEIIKPDAYKVLGWVANDRAIRDGEVRKNRRQNAIDASAAAAEARRKNKDPSDGDLSP